jgi:hypothetical protein
MVEGFVMIRLPTRHRRNPRSRRWKQESAITARFGQVPRQEDPKPMEESDFWLRLEYRVCQEIEGLKQSALRRYWCDGFIPTRYALDELSPRIVGRAWMGVGPREQQEWEFVLRLAFPVESRESIVWSALLPAPSVTRWLTIDPLGKRLVIEPAVAMSDED